MKAFIATLLIAAAVLIGCEFAYAGKLITAEDHIQRGMELSEEGNLQMARNMFDVALMKEPDNMVARFMRARTNAGLGNHAEAIADYDIVIDRDQTVAAYFHNRGSSYGKLGQLDQALADYKIAVTLDPDSQWSYYEMANVLIDMGKYGAASAAAARAATVNTNNYWAYLLVAIAEASRMDYAEALSAADKVIAASPGNLNAHSVRAHSLIELGRYEEGLKSADEVVRLAPDNYEGYNLKGYALSALGRYDEAVNALETGIALEPGSRVLALNLAYALIGQNTERGISTGRALLVGLGLGDERDMIMLATHALLDRREEMFALLRELTGENPDIAAAVGRAIYFRGYADDAEFAGIISGAAAPASHAPK